MIKDAVEHKLQLALQKLNINESATLDHPANSSFGDYTSNIAMKLSKQMGKNPMEIAQQIADAVEKDDLIEKVEVMKPGFINIWLTTNILLSTTNEIINLKNNFGNSDHYKNVKIITEYTDPNPFKEFHIGHLYSNIVGESLSRLLEANGAEVKRVNYQGDVGMHVAKSLWGIKKKMNEDNRSLKNLENEKLEERIKFIGQAYALGATKYEGDEVAKKEIIEINKQVYAKDPSIYNLYLTGREWSLEYFEMIYKRLNNNNDKGHFDEYYFESNVGIQGTKIVLDYLEKGLFEKSEGAIIFPGKKYGLHDRVFINSLGLPTYEAKELGLAFTKYADFKYDKSVIITGNEIDSYFKVLLTALTAIDKELGDKTTHISHGMVKLPDGKMSSRTGKIKTGEWLLNEAYERACKRIQETTKTTIDPTQSIVAEKVGVGAVKYALLKNGIGKDIEFNFDESISFEGNAGPYLQYTYVRCQSILKKADYQNIEKITDTINFTNEELSLLRLFSQYSELVLKAGENLSPNIIITYLYNLSQAFNVFYQKNQILNTENPTKKFRLALTFATAQVIKNGLYLLGIETVEKM